MLRELLDDLSIMDGLGPKVWVTCKDMSAGRYSRENTGLAN
jgi:hypothetical protein